MRSAGPVRIVANRSCMTISRCSTTMSRVVDPGPDPRGAATGGLGAAALVPPEPANSWEEYRACKRLWGTDWKSHCGKPAGETVDPAVIKTAAEVLAAAGKVATAALTPAQRKARSKAAASVAPAPAAPPATTDTGWGWWPWALGGAAVVVTLAAVLLGRRAPAQARAAA